MAKPRQPCMRCGGPKEAGPRRHLCEACRVIRADEKRPEARRKPCLRCGGDKGDGRRRRYCDACREIAVREKRLAAKKLDWERHREKRRASKRAHYELNADAMRARAREAYAANPAMWNESARAWKQANRDHANTIRQRRRARQREAFVEDVHPLVVLERHDGVCGICRGDVDPFDFHIDHVMPLARGGEHSYRNTQPAHPVCNMRKGAKVSWHLAA